MKNLSQLRINLRRLHASGYSWREIGEVIGKSKSLAWQIARGNYEPGEGVMQMVIDSLPEYLKESTEELEKRVWEIVKAHPGPENAIPQKEVARMVGVPVRRVRIITLALVKKNYPVGSITGARKKKGEPLPPRGLFRMVTQEEIGRYADQLWSRVRKTAYRARLVDALDLGDGHTKQTSMF